MKINLNNRGNNNNKKLMIMFGSFLVGSTILLATGSITNNNENLDTQNKSSINRSSASSKSTVINNEYLILVNKENHIGCDHVADDLVVPTITFNASSDMTKHVREDVAVALQDMFKAAEKDGIDLVGISAYRSYEYQETVYSNKVKRDGLEEAEKYVAEPGTSEHQTGLAIDVLSSEYDSLDEGFEDTEAFTWLSRNMSKYGFILRYPKGKEDITGYDYEPWHIRYVGVGPAIEIMDKKITLEEYLDK